MDTVISPTTFACAWFVGMVVAMEIGRRIGTRHLAKDPTKEMAGMDMMGGAVFALCGLLLAFTLTGSTSRYDERRMLLVEEANDIGTAYMRIDLLPDTAQPPLRTLFRNYVDSRLRVYSQLTDIVAAKTELRRSEAIQIEIWSRSVTASRSPAAHVDAAKLLLPAINAMIDITAVRLMAARIHPPHIMYSLLFHPGAGLLPGSRYANGGRKGSKLAAHNRIRCRHEHLCLRDPGY